jgi:methionine-rich copper-binding protein CopC
MRQQRLLIPGAALLLSILTYLCTIALIQPSVVLAHAYVIGSDPVDGSTVAQVPKEVHIYFNAAVSPLSSAHVYSIQGGDLINVAATPSQVAPLNARELVLPIKTPSAQPEGAYEVIWSAVANDDGHTTEGIIGFDVGFSGFAGLTGTPILGPSTSNDIESIHTLDLTALLAILWEWLVFVALTVWVGILVMEQFVLVNDRRDTPLFAQIRGQTYLLQRLCLITLLFGESVTLFLRVLSLIKVQQSDALPLVMIVSMITQTNYGHIWLLRMVLIALAMVFLYWISKKHTPSQSEYNQDAAVPAPESSEPTPEYQVEDTNQGNDTGKLRESAKAMPVLSLFGQRGGWLCFAGLLIFLFVLTDSAAQVLQPHFSAILFDWLKDVAQSVWFGSFAYLAYALLPILKTKQSEYVIEKLMSLQKKLTSVLLASICLQILSLIFLSDTSIHDLQQLHTDPYGIALAVQLIIIVITTFLSIYMLFVLRPRIIHEVQLFSAISSEELDRYAHQSRLRKMGYRLKIATTMVSVLGIGVLLCSALMSFFAPPIVFPDQTYTNQLGLPIDAVHTQTKQIGPFSVTLELLPGHIDQYNTVIMLIKDSKGKIVTDAQVQLTVNMPIMNMGTSHALITGGNPVYAATFDLDQAFNMAGFWAVNSEIQRPNQQAVEATFQVMLS